MVVAGCSNVDGNVGGDDGVNDNKDSGGHDGDN